MFVYASRLHQCTALASMATRGVRQCAGGMLCPTLLVLCPELLVQTFSTFAGSAGLI